MKTNETTTAGARTRRLPKVTKTVDYPSHGPGRKIKLNAGVHQPGGGRPYFSVTGSIGASRQLQTGDYEAGGCLHDELGEMFPEIRPIIALHLSDANDGAPMYAEENGYYWLAGCCGGLGEQYHGGHGKTDVAALANHLRISESEAKHLVFEIRTRGKQNARQTFNEFVYQQRPRWAKEAKEAIVLLESLGRGEQS